MKKRKKKGLYGMLFSMLFLLTACGSGGKETFLADVTKNAEEYIVLSYGEFKSRTGNEAAFYHGTRLIGEIPDSPVCVIYSGEYDVDTGEVFLNDESMPIRVQGRLGDLLEGIKEEMSPEELAESLSADGARKAAFELLEGAGTAYYVGNNYVQISFDSGKTGEYDRLLLVSMDESEGKTIGTEANAWLEPLLPAAEPEEKTWSRQELLSVFDALNEEGRLEYLDCVLMPDRAGERVGAVLFADREQERTGVAFFDEEGNAQQCNVESEAAADPEFTYLGNGTVSMKLKTEDGKSNSYKLTISVDGSRVNFTAESDLAEQ